MLTLAFLPTAAQAALSINEIAWMGGASSANHEWIELYNSGGEPVSLDGYTLKDGMNLNVTLEGTIPANSYAVLERTSDDSAPGTAFFIYTGALVNSGATLTLTNSLGTIVEQVAGGENWQNIGGDNLTKETAQYTTAGWITAEATPGRQNKTAAEATPPPPPMPSPPANPTPGGAASPSPKKSSNSASETVKLEIPNTILKLAPTFQKVAYVNQPVTFEVKATGIGETIINSLEYTWNFGDSFLGVGKKTKHAFDFPGTYIVTIHARFGRHEQVARQEITVLPTTLSITRNSQHDIQIHNDAPYDVDVSGFLIKGDQALTLSAHTIMPAKGTITIAASRLEQQPGLSMVGVFDPEGLLLASTLGALPPAQSFRLASASVQRETGASPRPEPLVLTQNESGNPAPLTAVMASLALAPVLEAEVTKTAEEKLEEEIAAAQETSDTSASETLKAEKETGNPRWPYAAMGILIVLTLWALFKRPTQPVL